ncbi:MAG: acetate--CoA ligase family protein [Pseudomonadota bacterium]
MTSASDAFLNPSSVAVYGASDRPAAPGTHIFRNLISQGFPGEVVPVNPKYDMLGGHSCIPAQSASGKGVDLAVIAIPPAAVPGALKDCAAVGTRAAVVITAGFTDDASATGKSHLLAAAEAGGIQVMGPNCLGLVRPHLYLNATFQPALPPAGGLALLSQSGAICSSLADMAEDEGLGFSLMMSLGNSLKMGLGDAIALAADDPRTKVILAYVEGVRDGPRFQQAIRDAARSKPVLVLKAGRGAEGAAAAATHTGALVGSDSVFSAVLREAGAVQVRTLGEMIDVARLLSAYPEPKGDRLAIVTNGGGAGVLTADRLSDRGLGVSDLPDDVCARLDAVLSQNWSRRNPLDIIGDATANHYAQTIAACAESEGFDAVLTLLSPQSMTAPDLVAEAVLSAHHQSDKPVMSCFLGGRSVNSARARMRRQGVPDFARPEEAVRAFAIAVQAASVHAAKGAAQDQDTKVGTPSSALLAKINALDTAPAGLLSDTQSRQLLSAAGIPCPIPQLAASVEAAVEVFEQIGGPVVLKIASPDISHKSEVDGVELNLNSPSAVAAAFESICARARERKPTAHIAGVTVEPMVAPEDAREMLIGVTQDPAFGPVITVGAGGTLVELLGDVATGLIPLTRPGAHGLLAQTKMARLLSAYRNMAPVDIEALVDLLLRISDLCQAMPSIAEMDINPLIAAPSGLVAVDARIRLQEALPASGLAESA